MSLYYTFNPFTGTLDISLDTSFADANYIRIDGTSITTATIPFAQSIDVTGALDGSNNSIPLFIHCPLGNTIFGSRYDGYYTDCIRLDGEYKTTDASISNLFGFQDSSIWAPTTTAIGSWSIAGAPQIYGVKNASYLYGILAAPFSRSVGSTYSGTLAELDFFESQLSWGSGTATEANLFHGKIISIGGIISSLNGIKIENITGGGTNRAIRTALGIVQFGDDLIFGNDNTDDIGASGATRPRTGYFGTNVSSPIFTSTVATGTAPFTVTSTTNVPNLNASSLNGSAVGTSGATIPLLNAANTIGGIWTFTDGDLALRNPANTFSLTIKAGAQTAARTWTHPVQAGNNVYLSTVGAQTIQGTKTFTLLNLQILGDNTGTGIAAIEYDDATGLNGTLTIPDGGGRIVTAQSGPVFTTLDVGLQSVNLVASGNGFNIVMSTGGTGGRLGTATNQLIGIWNATPIVQPINTVAIDTALTNIGLRASGGVANFDTDVKVSTAGKGLFVKTGSNCKMGTGTLTAGTVTISTTAVTASSIIFLTDTTNSIVNLGSLTVSAISAGTSFTVKSSNVADSSTFNWVIFEPA